MSSQLFFRVSSRSINSSCRCYHHHRPRQLLLTTAVSSTPNTTISTHDHHQHQFQYQQYQTKRMMGHTVRVIALEDLPHGKAYKGDVVTGVKAGYARNYLIPRKLALYATPQNFQRLQIVDPDDLDQQQQREATSASAVSTIEDQYLKDADLLKKYLKNKVLQIWRTVDPNSSTEDVLHPGIVTSENLRQKLSKQLKIDLDVEAIGGESIHIYHNVSSNKAEEKDAVTAAAAAGTTMTTNPINFSELDDTKIQTMVDDFIPENKSKDKNANECSVRINRLGDYLAVIGLNGGYNVPLRFIVRQRRA